MTEKTRQTDVGSLRAQVEAQSAKLNAVLERVGPAVARSPIAAAAVERAKRELGGAHRAIDGASSEALRAASEQLDSTLRVFSTAISWARYADKPSLEVEQPD